MEVCICGKYVLFVLNVLTSYFVPSGQYHLSGALGQEPSGIMRVLSALQASPAAVVCCCSVFIKRLFFSIVVCSVKEESWAHEFVTEGSTCICLTHPLLVLA